MKKKVLRILWLLLALLLGAAGLTGCGSEEEIAGDVLTILEEADELAMEEADASQAIDGRKKQTDTETEAWLAEDGLYTSKDEVALYIHLYEKLPANYITKKQAHKLGWEGGPLEPYAPGKSIGGDHFGNYEGALPEKKNRTYRECDIDTKGKSRGAKRIIFSNDGLIYYTDDHYETFTLLYGEE